MENSGKQPADEGLPGMAVINRELAPFQKSDTRRAVGQLFNTLIPYFLLWYLMIRSLEVSYALTLVLALIAAGFLVRIFIFFHDCGHNSFFPSTRANKIAGAWLGLLVFTPGEQWWHSHALHHASSSNLDKRGRGDVMMLTEEEYLKLNGWQRLGYRLFRNPLVMFILGSFYMFVISHRLPLPRYGKKEIRSVIFNNLGILAIAAGMSLLIGWKAYLMIQLPVLWMAGIAGVWLFYLQHQFQGSYWRRSSEWNYIAAGLLGASFYHLPKLLDWFTGSIGYHHIHHLSPRIPNYYLARCHAASPTAQKYARVLTIRQSLGAVRLKLWSEKQQRMVDFPRLAERSESVLV
jgi:omega-6 fatty acid desaturase (delta-12 desaturase)